MSLNWNDSLVTGVRQIDLQHQELIEIINELEAAHTAGRQAEALNEVLPRLGAYVLFHFGTEESLMSTVAAPAHAEKHRRQHDEFSDRVAELHTQPIGDIDLGAFVAYLQRWLLEHIMKTDRELGRLILDQVKIGR